MPENTIDDAIYHQGFYIIDHFLDDIHYHALQTLIRNTHTNGYFKPAKIGHEHQATHNTMIRTDQIYWLDETTTEQATAAYFSAIHQISTHLNRTLYLGLVDYEAHFAIYKPATFYKRHIDQFFGAKTRRISCVYYLNEHWQEGDGGELSLYDQNDTLLSHIQPIGNRFICFSSELPHEVQITHQMRYSIAGWLKTRSKTLL